jgi:phospholipid/cholesterol/gamma-HCH transport system substrate-binding protein
MRELTPVLQRAKPTFSDFRVLFDAPGAHNDLYDALIELPSLAKEIKTTFPRARKGLRDSTPVFSFARPYVPDLVSFVSGFGGAFATYDANGHYARTLPVFDAFNFHDDSSGGSLTPKSPSARGQSADLQGGMLRRCPGTAAPAPSDGSGPWVDPGPLANPDCDPSQVPGASR